MAVLTQRAANIVFSGARIWYAPLFTPHIAPTVAFGVVHAAPWKYVGVTTAPVAAQIGRASEQVEVQQVMGVFYEEVTTESIELETVLAEITGDNMALATGSTAVSHAATGPTPGPATPEYVEILGGGSTSLPAYLWMIEGRTKNVDGVIFPVRLFVLSGSAAYGAELQFSRTEAQGINLRVVGRHLTEDEDGDPIPEGEQLYRWYKVLNPALLA